MLTLSCRQSFLKASPPIALDDHLRRPLLPMATTRIDVLHSSPYTCPAQCPHHSSTVHGSSSCIISRCAAPVTEKSGHTLHYFLADGQLKKSERKTARACSHRIDPLAALPARLDSAYVPVGGGPFTFYLAWPSSSSGMPAVY